MEKQLVKVQLLDGSKRVIEYYKQKLPLAAATPVGDENKNKKLACAYTL